MTKFSYRMLKWIPLAAMAASLATACVVSSDDDGDDTNIPEGGSSGSASGGKSGSSTGGKSGSSTGGSTTGGTGGTANGGTAGDGGTPGEGGTPPAYMAGLCEEELGTMTPAEVPSCDPSDKDETNPCLKCMKANCCETWQACYGTNPTTACGYGPSEADDLGQFDCIQQCFVAGNDGIVDTGELLMMCADQCLNQCDGKDDFVTTGTSELVGCTQDNCLEECYPIQ